MAFMVQDCGDEEAAQACLSRLQDYGAYSKESARSTLDRLRSAVGSGLSATPTRADSPLAP